MGVEGEMNSTQDVELGEVKAMLRGVLEVVVTVGAAAFT